MVLAFGDHRLDIKRRELRRGTELIDLEPKGFDLLAFLVQHRDRVVSKDDLLQEVWGGRIVSESTVTTRINAVRRALGDDGTAQRLVRTFTRKGIRFVGEVTEVSDPAAPTASDPPAGLRRLRHACRSSFCRSPILAAIPSSNILPTASPRM
jgi:DNA-binding winged helix-turn-helix (wHTH) protein